ncbi:hypothetical protein GQ53DRAFT_823201 [Thozetella sp. PMI_491]|nr:hypothetical protein GQ53DRAFT_823201 [Thozetella sp. PMI_491]
MGYYIPLPPNVNVASRTVRRLTKERYALMDTFDELEMKVNRGENEKISMAEILLQINIKDVEILMEDRQHSGVPKDPAHEEQLKDAQRKLDDFNNLQGHGKFQSAENILMAAKPQA